MQCEHAGCPFKALPKLVSAHAVVHTRALPSLNTPEEIARYRAERRKNFPTDANVKKKQEEEEEKRKRGEIPEVAPNRRGKRGRGGMTNFGSRAPHNVRSHSAVTLLLMLNVFACTACGPAAPRLRRAADTRCTSTRTRRCAPRGALCTLCIRGQ